MIKRILAVKEEAKGNQNPEVLRKGSVVIGAARLSSSKPSRVQEFIDACPGRMFWF